MSDFTDLILKDIMRYRTVSVVDNVYWDKQSSRYVGSFIWNGLPTTVGCLSAFSNWIQSQMHVDQENIAVIGLRSSGIAWGTSVSLRLEVPLIPLRLQEHKYGPFNSDLRYYNPEYIIIVDNFCGSGDSLKRAMDIVAASSLITRHIFVVESSGVYEHQLLESMLLTPDKLSFLLRRGYFNPIEQEIVKKYTYTLDTYLNDIDWVCKVKQQLSSVEQ